MSQKPKGIEKLLKRLAKGTQPDPEERKRLQRASKERRASRGKQTRKKLKVRDLDGDVEDLGGMEKLGRAKGDSLADWVRRMGDSTGVSPGEDDSRTEGLVLSIGPGWCQVEAGGDSVYCDLERSIAQTQRSSLAVGDRVLFEPEAEPNPRVSAVLPRSSLLSRADPGRKGLRRAIVANVDLVVVVASARTPPLHPKLFDRYLVAIETGGASALLCVNKLDLVQDASERASVEQALSPYAKLGIPTVLCSASTGLGLDQLKEALAGKTCAFVGHSGVGKSSVLAALCPSEEIDTGNVSDADGKGRHTTTTSRMFELEFGARVIDTPGIREFALAALTLEELELGFPDVVELAASCRFTDCSHAHEPDCAVRAAVEVGELDRSRYESWTRLLGEVES